MENKILNQLLELNIVDEKQIITLFPRVRDRDDVSVLKCQKSGVIFLSTLQHIEDSYYNQKQATSYWSSTEDRAKGLKSTYEDDHRRFEQFRVMVTKKNYLDVGTGMGGVLEYMKDFAKETAAVEPIKVIRDVLNSVGHTVYESVAAIPEDKKYDVVSLFHVFEHLTTPLLTLKEIHEKMVDGGKIIIEVPHARDVLISTFDSEPFKKFTFWGEHLILHTRESLTNFLQAAGFKNVTVKGYQRYPLANHLHWLNKQEAGGHVKYAQFSTKEMDQAYMNLLSSMDQTDTIIAVAEK